MIGHILRTLERVTRPPRRPWGDLDTPLAEAEESRECWDADELKLVGPPSSLDDVVAQLAQISYYAADVRNLLASSESGPRVINVHNGVQPSQAHRAAAAAMIYPQATKHAAATTETSAAASPAAGDPPASPAAGPPNLTFPDPAEMSLWPDWLLMVHAANCLLWPEHDELINELRTRGHAGEHAVYWKRGPMGEPVPGLLTPDAEAKDAAAAALSALIARTSLCGDCRTNLRAAAAGARQ